MTPEVLRALGFLGEARRLWSLIIDFDRFIKGDTPSCYREQFRKGLPKVLAFTKARENQELLLNFV